MNTKDFPVDLDDVMDAYTDNGTDDRGFLSAMFEKQWELVRRYHEIESANGALVVPLDNGIGGIGDLNDRGVQMRLKDLAYRVVEELSECTNTLKNKPWKQDYVETDAEHFYEELADAFHFFLEFCITAGLDAEGLTKVYFAKSEVNKFRQRSGY